MGPGCLDTRIKIETQMKKLEIEKGWNIWAVCISLADAAPATAEFNGVRITAVPGDTAEMLHTRWNNRSRANYEENAQEQYQQRLARVRQVIMSTSVDEAARVIVNELHPLDHYGC